jgi:Uncharacterized protein conserved in bacteria (DUF2330)
MGRITLAAIGLAMAVSSEAGACGCFTPPDPTVPVLQAGEKILFAREGNEIVAQIQIQYAGDAKDFGWLLPLPSVPKLELGIDEVFTYLTDFPRPKYILDYVNSGLDCSVHTDDPGARYATDLVFSFPETDMASAGPPSPLVVASSIGPYDYAVLKADDKAEMLGWLSANRYFVPGGSDALLGPYLHPGAYFLALKLHSGQSAGDLQPVIVRYTSDLPMIPIMLTSTGATPHMGIAVWLVGEARAIPRNYYHTVLDDAAIDWTRPTNYGDVLTRAVAEAPGRHSFVTEFAGSGRPMASQLDWVGRFGDTAHLATIADPVDYIQYLKDNGYAFNSALVGVLARYIPPPDGVDPTDYFRNFGDYVYQGRGPGAGFVLDAAGLTADVVARVVEPTRATAKLFTVHPYLTRLFTTLSPEDMTVDPVFSWNPSLPEVSSEHRGTLDYWCGRHHDRNATLHTEQGFAVDLAYGTWSSPDVPASLRTEILREEGPPEVVADHTQEIQAALRLGGGSGGGCTIERTDGTAARRWPLAAIALIALAAIALAGRRRS